MRTPSGQPIKPIPSTNGHYGASADGTIWRIKPRRRNTHPNRRIPYPLRPMDLNGKYHLVNLYLPQAKGCKHKAALVHSLVAEAWLGPRRGRDIHHLADSKDNSVANIRYITRSEHCREHEDNRGDPRTRKLSRQDVRRIRRDGLTSREIMDEYGVSRVHAWRITRGKAWPHVFAKSPVKRK